MCSKNKRKYFKLMGLVTCVVTLAMIVGLIVTLVGAFRNYDGAWPIVKTLFNIIAVLAVGTAVSNLFYSHAELIAKTNKANN